PGLRRRQRRVDLRHVLLAERPGGRIEPQPVEQRVVTRAREVAPGAEQLLLRVEDVDVDAYADLIAEQVRVERKPARAFGRLQRAHLSKPAVEPKVGLSRALFG